LGCGTKVRKKPSADEHLLGHVSLLKLSLTMGERGSAKEEPPGGKERIKHLKTVEGSTMTQRRVEKSKTGRVKNKKPGSGMRMGWGYKNRWAVVFWEGTRTRPKMVKEKKPNVPPTNGETGRTV